MVASLTCDFDIFGKEIPVYTVKQCFSETADLLYENGQHTIFLNTRYKEKNGANENLLEFLDYLRENKVAGDLAQHLDAAVMEARYNDEWRQSYMDYKQLQILWRTDGLEAGREEGRKLGREEGREEARNQMVKNMLLEGEPVEKIRKYTGMTEDAIKRILEELKADNNEQ